MIVFVNKASKKKNNKKKHKVKAVFITVLQS